MFEASLPSCTMASGLPLVNDLASWWLNHGKMIWLIKHFCLTKSVALSLVGLITKSCFDSLPLATHQVLWFCVQEWSESHYSSSFWGMCVRCLSKMSTWHCSDALEASWTHLSQQLQEAPSSVDPEHRCVGINGIIKSKISKSCECLQAIVVAIQGMRRWWWW